MSTSLKPKFVIKKIIKLFFSLSMRSGCVAWLKYQNRAIAIRPSVRTTKVKFCADIKDNIFRR